MYTGSIEGARGIPKSGPVLLLTDLSHALRNVRTSLMVLLTVVYRYVACMYSMVKGETNATFLLVFRTGKNVHRKYSRGKGDIRRVGPFRY